MKAAVYGDHIIMDNEAADYMRAQSMDVGEVTVAGRTVPAAGRSIDVVQMFRNLGAEIPTGIKTGEYKFTGLFTPYAHQIDTADFLAGYRKAYCFNSPGTGKTASAIWAADYLMDAGVISRVLVLCPLTCMQSVWGDELFGTTPHRAHVVLSGDRKQRTKLLNLKTPWVVANHDSVSSLHREFIKSNFDLVVVDEATAFKTAGAERSKALGKLANDTRLWLLTGTPIPQDPMDAYFLTKLINPKAVSSQGRFSEMTRTKVSQFRWVPKKNVEQVLYGFMQPAIRYDKSDCLDLPDVVVQQMKVPATVDQTKTANAFKREWVADVDGATIKAVNAAVKLSKIMQIGSGMVIDTDDDGTIHPVDCLPKLEMTHQLITESASKTLIFVPFRGAIEIIRDYLESKGVTCAVIHGDVPTSKRDDVVNAFQTMADPQVIIAHPRTTSHGLTLTAASTTIWFGPVFSGEVFQQANERTNRPGQKQDMRIIMLHSLPEEKKVFDGLINKGNMQATLLGLYKRIVVEGE